MSWGPSDGLDRHIAEFTSLRRRVDEAELIIAILVRRAGGRVDIDRGEILACQPGEVMITTRPVGDRFVIEVERAPRPKNIRPDGPDQQKGTNQ